MKNYELADQTPENDLTTIRITEGEFKNVEFAFNTIKFNGGDRGVTMDFDVLKSPDERSCQDIENMASFQEMIEKIIIYVFEIGLNEIPRL